MRIALVTPAAASSRSGNRVTANRWAQLLRSLGHDVTVSVALPRRPHDLLLAIHAWRSAAAVRAFRAARPGAPIVVLLAGTDIYKFQHSHPEPTLATMAAADALVGLHDNVYRDIPSEFAGRLTVIKQSCALPSVRQPRFKRWFQVTVLAHLRDEKDPLRAAYAARLVPSASRLRITHMGGAHSPEWQARANREAAANPRFTLRGEVPRARALRQLQRSHALVISSVCEGGANVVTEASALGTAVIASDISGNRGLLGNAHPAYFPVGDEHALAQLLWRCEHEPDFLQAVQASGHELAPALSPDAERDAWRALLASLTG
ncbi:MAG: selenoneine biosynthesis selenosugar synthase SenB [Pseudomonadota bacterium]